MTIPASARTGQVVLVVLAVVVIDPGIPHLPDAPRREEAGLDPFGLDRRLVRDQQVLAAPVQTKLPSTIVAPFCRYPRG